MAVHYGHLDKDFWMELPEGYSCLRKEEHKDNIKNCLLLTIYKGYQWISSSSKTKVETFKGVL
jgi:hypothetical protein